MNRQKRGAQRIYNRNADQTGLESVSGTGSTTEVTGPFREYLEGALRRFSITSIADLPCGDWNWMQLMDLEGIDYWGGDIVEEIVAKNQARFSSPSVKFETFDIVNSVPPTVDLIICRDFLFHVTLSQAAQAVANFRASGSRYLLTTTFDDVAENSDLTRVQKLRGWGWRSINVELEPFGLTPVSGEDVHEPTMGRHQRLFVLAT